MYKIVKGQQTGSKSFSGSEGTVDMLSESVRGKSKSPRSLLQTPHSDGSSIGVFSQSLSSAHSTIKDNRHASEIVKTVNLLVSSLSSDFLWDYMARRFEECFR